MSLQENSLDFLLAASLLFNLIFGLILIGVFIRTPKEKTKNQQKKAKNPDQLNLMIGIAVGFLGGMLGNITITSMFELVKTVNMTSLNWGAIFLISFIGSMFIFWEMFKIIKDAIGE